ncbi:MAG: hypothetical protein HYY11_04020 [Candidatus Methylomirabilis oxyfera]|nr:hypothetical protein [Candidatus Methylomirabilis oxyfera]
MSDERQFSGRNPQHCCVRIADITIGLLSDDPKLSLPVEGAMSRFLVDETDPDVNVSAAWGDLDREWGGERLFDCVGWQLYAEGDSYCFRFTSQGLGSFPYKVASFHREFTSGEVTLHRPYFPARRLVYPFEYPLDELLITHLLARGRGVELHACGVVDAQGKGHLFLGQSGAGKSTMARLWHRHGTVLSDDRIILREVDKRLWMYGTPWHGEAEFACPARAPLTELVFLRHGRSNERVPLGGAEAAARLFACSFPPFYSRGELDFTLRFLEQVVKSVPYYEFRFVADDRVVAFMLEHSAVR